MPYKFVRHALNVRAWDPTADRGIVASTRFFWLLHDVQAHDATVCLH